MSKFVDKIELLEEYRGIKPFSIDLKEGLNVIVGENGSGKSSICNLIDKHRSEISYDREVSSKYLKLYKNENEKFEIDVLDTEKMNPRIQGCFNGDISFQVSSMYSSHGQTAIPLLFKYTQKNDMFLVLDEPEAGISIKSQVLIAYYLNKNTTNSQTVIMTHSIPIISSVKEVFSLDEKKWISSFIYLNENLSKSKILIIN